MSSTDKSKSGTSVSSVSLFPPPPKQLIDKLFVGLSKNDSMPRPPTPPLNAGYRMFGHFYDADDTTLRSLESQGVRRVYSQTYNRKRELRKINFSILANYLDLLDIITRDPGSPKRTEKLDHLAILFVNMHHLINEYRQHQARDLLREILRYQVNIGTETAQKAELYLKRSDEILKMATGDITFGGAIGLESRPNSVDSHVRSGLNEFGPQLAPLLQNILDEMCATNENPVSDQKSRTLPNFNRIENSNATSSFSIVNHATTTTTTTNDDGDDDGGSNNGNSSNNIDMALWEFLFKPKQNSHEEMDVECSD